MGEWRQACPMVRAVVVATGARGVVSESYVEGVDRDLDWTGRAGEGIPFTDWYPISADAGQLHSIKSVTKSVLCLLVGIAIDNRVIPGLDLAVGDLLPAARAQSDKARIGLADLLAMRSGLEWEENGAITVDYLRSGDPLLFTLERQRVRHQPGAVAEYSTADSHLLACVLAAAAGAPLESLAERWLFNPLGIREYKWLRDATGTVIGGSELFLRPRDMAALGLLVLGRGEYAGQRVVSQAWLDRVTTAQPDIHPPTWMRRPVSELRTGYAHHWWRGAIGGHDIALAHGLGGQSIQVYPQLEAVVVTTADAQRDAALDPVLDPSLVVSDRYVVPAIEAA